MRRVLTFLTMAATTMAVGSAVFISWRWGVVGLEAPTADWAGILLCATVPILLLMSGQRISRPPALPLALLFFSIAALSAVLSAAAGPSLHEWLRKGVFSYVAYAGGLAAIIGSLPRRWAARLVICSTLLLAGIGLVDTPFRIAAMGWATPRGIGGLVTNHKTLAVALAPQLPMLGWAIQGCGGPRWKRLGQLSMGLGILWILLSMSRSAWIIAVCAGILGLRRGTSRQRWALVILFSLALSAAAAGLSLGRTDSIGDAAQARASLVWRAGELFWAAPLLGQGPGASVRYVAQEWPHLRVNGVEAHGVFQKLAAEVGLLGLLGWLAMAAGFVSACRDGPRGVRNSLILLHLMLVLSTEAFTSSHWVPLGICLGICIPGQPLRDPRVARSGLLAGGGLLLALLILRSLGPNASVGHLAVRASVLDFERSLAANSGEESPTYWEPLRCLWNRGPGGATAVCALQPRRLNDGAPLPEDTGSVAPGLYVLQRDDTRLMVIGAERPGLRLP